jgi:hypothetical protein
MKAYWRSGGIAPSIIDLGTRWRWVVSFTHRLLYPQGKSPWYSLDRTLGGPQSRSGRGDEEKNSQPLPWLEPPIIQPVAQCYTAELSQLLDTICRIYIYIAPTGDTRSTEKSTVSVIKCLRKWALGKPKPTWECNTKVKLQKIDFRDVNWTEADQCQIQVWTTFVINIEYSDSDIR